MHQHRVHFNPVVSRLRYRERRGDPHDDSSDKNRVKNYMKNGRNINGNESLCQNPRVSEDESERPQRVFVTIAVAPCTRDVRSWGQFSVTQRRDVPDLLQTTPLFRRKSWLLRERETRSETGGKDFCQHPANDATKLDPKKTASTTRAWNWKSLIHKFRLPEMEGGRGGGRKKSRNVRGRNRHDRGKVSSTTTLHDPSPGEMGPGPQFKVLGTGQIPQIDCVSFNKNDFKESQTKNDHDQEKTPLRKETIEESPAKNCLANENSGENEEIETTTKVFPEADTGEDEITINVFPEANTGEDDVITKVVPETTSGSTSFSYKKSLDAIFHNSDLSDPLSANVEKILEEVAGLESIIEKGCEMSVEESMKTSPSPEKSNPAKTKEEEIAELVSECCAVSSALSRLTASVNCLETPSKHSETKEETKPPLPPRTIAKLRHMNLVLRHNFFQPSVNGAQPALENGYAEKMLKLDLGRSRVSNFHPEPFHLESIDHHSMRSTSTIDRFSGWESSTSSEHSENSINNRSKYNEANLAKQWQWDSIAAQAREKLVVSPPSSYPKVKHAGDFQNASAQGILETDLDTGTSREISGSELLPCQISNVLSELDYKDAVKTLQNATLQRNSCSMQNLNIDVGAKEDRSRSMEFLLDDEKHAQLMAPENNLKKNQESRKPSEHELSIQRSLQRLNVPDWYKNYATPTGTPLSENKTSNRDFGSGTGLAGGWTGLSSSKTASLTSLQSAGRYAGSKTQFSSARYRGTASAGGRSSREYLMSPSSTASASPSPYYERGSFAYGMPYALTRFATARMSCGASPASLSPSPSPVGGITSTTSTPVTSGSSSRYGYHKTPYLGWRSQERLSSKTLYRSPSERLAADLIAQKQKASCSTPVSTGSEISIVTSPRKETASDLSLNISDTSESSNKLNRVRSSIKEVSNAIVDYVNETKPLDDNINGRASPRRGLIWLESSFVGTKPIDSPGTPEAPSVFMSKHLGAQGIAYLNNKRSAMKLDHNAESTKKDANKRSENSQVFASYLSRNEKPEERSNTSSVSSPTLDDILSSLLALRPQKKFRVKGHTESPPAKDIVSPKEPLGSAVSAPRNPYDAPPVSDWQQRMTPLDDTMYFPQDLSAFESSTADKVSCTTGSNNEVNQRASYFQAVGDAPTGGITESDIVLVRGALSPSKEKRAGVIFQDDNEDDVSGRIAQEESSFGVPTEITIVPTLIHNPLAGLTENSSSNPSTPGKHRRVSFDLDVSDKDEKSSSRSKRDESVGGSIQCKNPKCGNSATGLEARREYKTCHNCNAYYCSRECRRTHWEKHKKVCMQSRVGQLCKQIITHVKEDSFAVSQLSVVAKRGFLAKGRGCVKLFFSSPDRAERYLTGGLPELPEPWYVPQNELLPEDVGIISFSEISESCRNYNPETRFVLYVSVCVVNEVPTSGAVKWEREMINRSSKIRLLLPRSFDENQPHHLPARPVPPNPEDIDPRVSPTPGGLVTGLDDGSVSTGSTETLILRSVPTPASLKLNSAEDRRRREISFHNIQKNLQDRGVDLRRHYPDIYSKLCNYVENDEPFLPVTIYPRNSNTGAQFMCIIMPESSDTSYELSVDPSRKIETVNISES